MRGRRHRRWLGLALAGYAVAVAAAPPAGPIDRCLAQIADGRYHPNVDLCVACPEVAATIRQPTLAAMLDKPLRCPLKLAEAADVAAYRYDAARTPPEGLSPAALSPVLAELALKPPTADGWWERFRRWLRHWLTEDDGSFPPWLEQWLKSLSLPPWFGDIVFKTTLLVILVLAAVIVFNELRALRWRGTMRRRFDSGTESAPGARPMPRTLADVRALPLTAQPGALLQYVIIELVHAGRLPDRRDQTNHELALALRQRTPDLAARFARLVTDVERAVYGGRRLDGAGTTTLWRNAEEVLTNFTATGNEAGKQ